MNQSRNPSFIRLSMPELSLESVEVIQIKCSDYDNAVFVNNHVVQATISQKDNEIATLKKQLESINSTMEE